LHRPPILVPNLLDETPLCVSPKGHASRKHVSTFGQQRHKSPSHGRADRSCDKIVFFHETQAATECCSVND
jgi:hypothetical protein